MSAQRGADVARVDIHGSREKQASAAPAGNPREDNRAAVTAAEIEALATRLRADLEAQGRLVSVVGNVRPGVAAAVLGVQPATLKKWRSIGRGPRYCALGRVWYPLRDLAEFILRSTRCPTARPGDGG